MKKDRILTGVRPTGSLSIANYLGAIKHIIDLQNAYDEIFLFVADLHALKSVTLFKMKYPQLFLLLISLI